MLPASKWKYYKRYAGPHFRSVGTLMRWGDVIQTWDPATQTWITVPGVSLMRSVALGDPMTEEISADEATALQGELLDAV